MHHCNFSQYYCQQAGNGFSVYKGTVPQRGYGIFSNLFRRFGVPLLKYIGRQGFNYGKKVGEDVLTKDINLKEALKNNLAASAKTIAFDGLSKAAEKVGQMGTGRRRSRRKRTKPVAKPAKRKRKRAPAKKTIKKKPAKKKAPTKRKAPVRRRSTRRATRSPGTLPNKDIFGY